MAGLLDFLNDDGAKLGLGLLAAAGPSTVPMNAFQRIQMAQQGMSADKAQAMKLKLLESQIEENKSQDLLRKAQVEKAAQLQGMTGNILGSLGGMGGSSAGSMPSAPGAAPAESQAAGLRGVPLEKIAALKAAGGPDLVDAWKLANVPNSFSAGSYTQLPGQQPQYYGDPSKGFNVTNGRVGVMPGAPEANAELTRATERVKAEEGARFQEATPTLNPDGSKSVRTRLDQYGSGPLNGAPRLSGGGPIAPMGARLPPPNVEATGSFVGEPGAIMNAIMGIKDPQERSNALAGYAAQQQQKEAPAGNVVELSPAQIAKNAADQTYQTSVAKDEVEQRKGIMQAGFAASTKIAKLEQIDKLLGDFEGGKLSQAGVEFASTMNSLGIKVDKNLPNKEASQAMSREIALSLRNPAGGAGMPGAMSDADRQFLSSMTPDIGQTAQGRKQIIGAAVAVEKRNQQVAEFARKYEGKYGKLDNGFYTQLSAWSSANQLFGANK